jgi:hypothetical protein
VRHQDETDSRFLATARDGDSAFEGEKKQEEDFADDPTKNPF